jgi:hypothetical protein
VPPGTPTPWARPLCITEGIALLGARDGRELRGQPGWAAALTPLSVDGMIVAASTTLLAA